MVTLFIVYSALVLAIAFWYRKHTSGDEYLMGNRKASALLVASALFTLVGGGELVTLTSLSYTYGYAGLSLFIGYALGFFFLGFISSKIRSGNSEQYNLSLPDYAHQHFGFVAGQVVFYISFGAFFSMLLIQFTAGGQVLSSLTSFSYEQSVIITALVCTAYLFIGGFKTVLATDLVQGIARLTLMPLIVYVAYKGLSTNSFQTITTENLPKSVWISLIVTGFFSAASSADVWQRIYVAKSNNAAKLGLIGGGFLLLLFGASLVSLGLVAKSSGTITNPDLAFTQALSTMLPYWAVILAVILVISTIMSTADTEMFLLSGMALREIIRFKGEKDPTEITKKQSVLGTRVLMVIITGSAVLLSLKFRELVPIYTWLLSALLIIAPMILSSLFLPNNPVASKTSLFLNLFLFCILVYFNLLTPENAYYIIVPGLLVYFITYFITTAKK
jgi:solute:Na+ symporter, SSS family